jgi:hypothetical protein
MTVVRAYSELGICVAGLAFSTVAFVYLGQGGWPGAVHECVATSTCYCEAGRLGWIAQPANTWSSLAFIAAGLAIAWHAGWDRTTQRSAPGNPIASTHVYPGLLALSVCLLGPGAMFFHASLTDWGGVLDIASMYLFLNFWLFYNLKRLYGWSDAMFFTAYVVGTVAFTSPRLLSPAYGVPVFVVVATLTLATEWVAARPANPEEAATPRRIERDRRWLWLALGALAIARAAETFMPCNPTSLIQGHAALHFFHALVDASAYVYLRSEQAGGTRTALQSAQHAA